MALVKMHVAGAVAREERHRWTRADVRRSGPLVQGGRRRGRGRGVELMLLGRGMEPMGQGRRWMLAGSPKDLGQAEILDRREGRLSGVASMGAV